MKIDYAKFDRELKSVVNNISFNKYKFLSLSYIINELRVIKHLIINNTLR